jgi:RNA polymerase sigma factor (sigma-70 family)
MDQLVDRIKSGDQRAYRELYQKFSIPMYNVCLRITNNAAEANDVLQDVFVKIFQNIKSLENAQLLPAWIKKITVNTALQSIQKNKKLQIDESIDPGNLTEIEILTEDSIFESEIEHELLISNIQDAIKMLPDRYRIVFTLHVIEDYSHEEISKMLGIVSSTSRSQYLRAKVKLIEILKKNKSHVRPIESVYSAT